MEKFREECYRNEAKELSDKLRNEGLMKSEIALLGYILLTDNIDSLEEEIKMNEKLLSLLKETEELLKNY